MAFLWRAARLHKPAGPRRKAYKLGKFLADVNKLRKVPITDELLYLELLANGGNMCYLFMEQLTWCATFKQGRGSHTAGIGAQTVVTSRLDGQQGTHALCRVPTAWQSNIIRCQMPSMRAGCIEAHTISVCRLVKAGVLSRRHQPRFTLISAWAELARPPTRRFFDVCQVYHAQHFLEPLMSHHKNMATGGLLRQHDPQRAHRVGMLGAGSGAYTAAASVAKGMPLRRCC